jgi:hypothetical protein
MTLVAMTLTGLTLVGYAWASSLQPETPEAALRRSMERTGGFCATLVQTHAGVRGRSPMQLKLMTDSRGRTRRTVLKPLSMQGIVSIDDGRDWITFNPDDRRVMIQPSPFAHRASPAQRMALVERNYRLRFEPTETIAGRRAIVLIAIPRADELPTRRYAFDSQTYLLLRFESIEAGSEPRVLLDTQTFDLVATQPAELFEAPKEPGIEVKRSWGPRRVDNADQAKAAIGFEPRLPRSIPYGFAVDDLQLLGHAQEAFLAVRITDGLAFLSVYQWDGARKYKEPPVRSRNAVRDADGIMIYVIGDVPEAVRERIARAFAADR